MIAPTETRLDQLEALASTTLLAIRELANRQEATQSQLDSFSTRQEATQSHLDSQHNSLNANLIVLDQRIEALNITLEIVDDRLNRVSLQQELNGQQIASNAAGIVELRNLVTDLVRGQRSS